MYKLYEFLRTQLVKFLVIKSNILIIRTKTKKKKVGKAGNRKVRDWPKLN